MDTLDPMPTTTRADAGDLSAGNAVRWSASGGTAYGRIDTKETSGTIQARPDGPSMEGTSDNPAFLVQVYEQGDDGWTGTDVYTVHRAGALTKIDGFPDQRSRGRGFDIKTTGCVKDVDMSKRVVTGFASTFGNEDSDGDVMMPGAYAKTIKERGPGGTNRIWHLDQHHVMRRINKPQVLEEKSTGNVQGLYFETRFPDTQLANDILTLYQEGAITEHSVGIDVVDRPDGDARQIREVKLWEVSTVTWGANPVTPSLGVKTKSNTDFTAFDAAHEHMSRLRSVLKEGVSDAMARRLELQLNIMERELSALATNASHGPRGSGTPDGGPQLDDTEQIEKRLSALNTKLSLHNLSQL